MINKIDQITINGSNQIWNGYIYNFNYSPSFGQSASSVTVYLISEDGTYSINPSSLSALSTHTIQVGNNITLQMYPFTYRKENGPNGKTLSIIYTDTSIILDKKIVILNGRQGTPADNFNGSCYIPLGYELLTLGDNLSEVLNIVYFFPDLINGIIQNGIVISPDSFNLIQNVNRGYYASYIGSLRAVLSTWCADLALGFYWENNMLHFIDLSTSIVLDTSVLDNAVQSTYSEEVSIADTVGRVAAAFYGQDAETQTLTNSQDTEISFKCVSLSQYGFTADQIGSIKAAYFGKAYFDSYHYYLGLGGDQYGFDILGIKACTISNDSGASKFDPVNTSDPNLSIYTPSNIFSYYFYAAQDTNIADANWTFYSELCASVGKYYYKPMIFGDFNLMKFKNAGTPNFYDQSLPCSSTCLAQLAANLGNGQDGQEALNAFLLGEPFSLDDAGFVNANTTSDGQGGYSHYENENGFCILDLGNPTWYLNGTPFSPLQAQNYLKDQLLTTNFIHEITSVGASDLSNQMNEDKPVNYNSVNNYTTGDNNPYKLLLYGIVSPLPANYTFNQDIIESPEEKNPNQLFQVTITQTVYNKYQKIEDFFRSETDKTGDTVNCHSNVAKNELNFRDLTKEDLVGISSHVNLPYVIKTQFASPIIIPPLSTPQNLETAFELFVQNLTYSKVDPTIVRTYVLPYIDLPNNYSPSIGAGLMNLTIRIDDKGLNTTYTYGTRFMQVPSLESVRARIEGLNGTAGIRLLPYNQNITDVFAGLAGASL